MGANQSDLKVNQQISDMCINEIIDFVNGNISKESLRYLFLLMKANFFFKYDQFYKHLSINHIADYLNDLGFIQIEEAKVIIKRIIEISNCEETATLNLQIILPKMRIKYNDEYISPSFCKELFNQIFSNSYQTEWGKYSPHTIIDWDSPEIAENYSLQSQEKLPQILANMPKLFYYVKIQENQTEPFNFTIFHSDDISELLITNHVDKLIKMNMDVFQGSAPFKKKIVKPIIWKKNIHEAAFSGDEQSVIYCLHLLPILLNCLDDNGNTPAHMASMGNCPNIVKLLFSLNADFSIVNNDGHLPHQISGGKNVIMMFSSLGFDLNQKDNKGETLFEIKTKDFNYEVIETLLKMNVNIFEPISNGSYWMQFAIHGEFYKKQMNFISFQKKIRKIIKNNLKKEIVKDQIIYEILNRKVDRCDEEDTIDINNSVNKRYIDRIKVLLALGSHADRIREDGKTNLLICAEKNDFEMAELLLKNFCDPNFKNERGENIFWISTYLKNLDTSVLLRDYGANLNELSLSGNTLLHTVYEEKKYDLFYFLLEMGCSPNVVNKNIESVLFQAFLHKDDQIAELLQDKYNGNINIKSQDDNSLAHIAILEQDFERINYYIKRGIDIELKNNLGYTIFMISIMMLDNLQFSSFLLENGADINTQDLNGNTALLNILHSKKFSQEKFDFLINNNCDINLQNIMGEFPISVCIIHELNDTAKFLLDKGCKINDNQTMYEPIANALKINSQYWFETLLEHGSTGSNEKFPIVSSYINSKFFNFSLLKKMKNINSVIGAPIQAALMKKYFDVALYIWEISNDQTRFEIAAKTDSLGRIPLSTAIIFDCEEIVKILINGNYEVMTPDLQNRTPFSYACQINQIEWILKIYSKITPQNANLVDEIGNSALTYAACNNNIEICNCLFLNNINVFDINADHNGIVNAYQKIIRKYDELKSVAYNNYNQSVKNYRYWCLQVNFLRSELNRLKSQSNNDSDSGSAILGIIQAVADVGLFISTEIQLSEAIEKRNAAEIIRNKYDARYSQICSLTRRDMLKNFNLIINLARNDSDIGNLQNDNFEVDSFLSSVSFILNSYPMEQNQLLNSN